MRGVSYRLAGMRYLIALLLVLISGIVLIVTTSQKRSSVYPYDPGEDYTYAFDKSESVIYDIDISGDTMYLPLGNLSGMQTSFIKVELDKKFGSRIWQPYIQLSNGNGSIDQYFEFGVEGARYLNVSDLLHEPADYIRFNTNHVSIAESGAQLLQFENDSLANATFLFISPHPDDAEIAGYGLYSTYKDVYVVTVTAGEAGSYLYDELYPDREEHFLKKGDIRTWNSITVPLLGGVHPDRIMNLGYFDGTLRQMAADREVDVSGLYTPDSVTVHRFRKQNYSPIATGLKGGANWNCLVANMMHVIQEIDPDVIITTHPELDIHQDHQYSTYAIYEALRALGRNEGLIYLYTNHVPDNEYYPYGPDRSNMSLPPWFSENLYFRRMYSHPLSASEQSDKMLALDAMNDLRPDTEWRSELIATVRAARRAIEEFNHGEGQYYFRRAVRSNELFYVLDVADIATVELPQGMLDDYSNLCSP